jgi:mannosyltransferase
MNAAITVDRWWDRLDAGGDRWSTAIVCVLLFAISLALGLYRIGHKSVWYDEAVSISAASGPIDAAWRYVTVRESNGALYHAVLWGWVHLVGIGEGAVRALSASFAAATVPILFLIGRRLFSWHVGVAAAILLSLQGFLVQYAQEARMYALAMLLATGASYLFLSAVSGRSRLGWLWYALALAAGVYAHLLVALVGAAHLAWLLAVRRDRLGVLWRSFALAAALCVPMLVTVVTRPGPLWMSTTTVDSARYVVTELVSGGWPIVDIFEGFVVLAAVLAFTRRSPSLGFSLAWLLFPIGLMLLLATQRPLVSPRYVLTSLPALALTAAAAAFALRPRLLQTGLLVLLVGTSLFGLVGWYTGEPKPNWRSATVYVTGSATPTDAVLFYPAIVRAPFVYYVERLGLSMPAPGLEISEAPGVWLVTNYLPRSTRPGELEDIVTTLEATHRAVGEPRNFNNVRVQQFVLR